MSQYTWSWVEGTFARSCLWMTRGGGNVFVDRKGCACVRCLARSCHRIQSARGTNHGLAWTGPRLNGCLASLSSQTDPC